MRVLTRITVAVAAAMVLAGCGGPVVVNTDEPRPTPSGPPPAPAPPPLNTTNLVNAFYFAAPVDGLTRYFFTTPSGRWDCAIIPRVQAGCQATDGGGLGVTGAPETVLDAAGEETEPNAVVIGREGDPMFLALADTPFTPDPGPANVLQFNQVLAAAGFRCNIQEVSGVSCLSELTRRGFSFSTEGFTPTYTEVPPGAPIAPPTTTTATG
ncbi:hypothetical protein E4P42_13335 [Mycobacterium sp. PS03-16]|uniref:hypothetical protein n=1 Tax=Mycobacterium sp. PS03-16 TaxID=2559611 RepID=UPI00107393D5|nr:hypothetical protein [Mycobacterium sp. PS03-16]TFV58028.1 hypothetical protein E4P42_13335 [Mycobacterium sp. PS03-16]